MNTPDNLHQIETSVDIAVVEPAVDHHQVGTSAVDTSVYSSVDNNYNPKTTWEQQFLPLFIHPMSIRGSGNVGWSLGHEQGSWDRWQHLGWGYE